MISFIVAIIAVLAGTTPQQPPQGTIKVYVTDLSGNPIVGAHARADQMNVMSAGFVPECVTDEMGKCAHEHLAPGEYSVNAGKPADNYPNMFIPLYRHGQPPETVQVTSSNSLIDVTLTLGPKAAVLTLQVTDAATGSQIKGSTIVLKRALNPDDYLSQASDVKSSVLVPTDDPIVVEVIADGYKPWHYATAASLEAEQPLKLHSGEAITIAAKLERDHR